jgi:hypothetical protein
MPAPHCALKALPASFKGKKKVERKEELPTRMSKTD